MKRVAIYLRVSTTSRDVRPESAFGGKAEIICSH